MSVDIWPQLPPEQLAVAIAGTRKRELEWLLEELHEALGNLKHGLDECYALLAPIDPGSTLVLSTQRNEMIKGHITRVGTRIVKGTIQVRMKTLPPQTLTLNQAHPIHLGPLTALNTILTQSIDLLRLTMSYAYDADPTRSASNADLSSRVAAIPPSSSPTFIAAQLRLLAQSLAEATALLKGPPLTESDPSWTYRSAAPSHFTPPLTPMHLPHAPHPHHSASSSALSALTSLAGVHVGGSNTIEKAGSGPGNGSGSSTPQQADSAAADSNAGPPALSLHFGIQDGSLMLWLRSLEPADAPMHFGTKLALAIGTTRRLEHDEAERVFGFCCGGDGIASAQRHPSPVRQPANLDGAAASTPAERPNTPGVAGAGVGAGAAKALGGAWSLPFRAGTPIARAATPLRPSSPGSVRDHGNGHGNNGGRPREVSVYVREKVRVESADPSLMSLSAKLTALGHTLALARRNLAAVMGEELED